MREGRSRLAPLLLGVTAAVCVAMSVTEYLTTGLLPFVASCCQALQIFLPEPINFWLSGTARGVLLAFLIVSTGLIARRFWRIRQFASTVNNLPITAPAGQMADICRRLDLEQQVVVLETPTPLAFCFSLLRPRIYVSTGLAATLTGGEIEAVLLHEAHHRRRYDPLRTLLVDILSTLFFFLPIVGEWRRSFLTAIELAADRHAIQLVGKPAFAGALHKLLSSGPAIPLANADGVLGFSVTEARIAHLLDKQQPARHVSKHGLSTSSMGLLLACTILQLALF